MSTEGVAAQRLDDLVEWACGDDVLREQDVEHAGLVVTDTVAAMIAASAEPEVAGFAHVAPGIGGPGPSTILASGARTSPAAAAWANGLAAVRLELDEGNQFAGNHPAAHVLPAALAVAEAEQSGGRALLDALSAGYEVAVRVARGFRLRDAVHPFGTAMICGAALAVARLRGMSAVEATRAVRIAAALTPASTQRAATRGATVRNAVSGACAMSAVVACELAASGTEAEYGVLDAVFGEILGTSYDSTPLAAALGTERYLTRNYFKVHACSRWNHAAIEATASLMRDRSLVVEDIDAIEVATYDPAIRLAERLPANGFAGKHSIPYSVAARLRYGANGIEQYTDDAVADPAVRALSARVRVVEDPAYTRAAPEIRAARVSLSMKDGSCHSAEETRAPGGFDRPYPREVLSSKHAALVGRALPEPTARSLLTWCAELPRATSVHGLAGLLGEHR